MRKFISSNSAYLLWFIIYFTMAWFIAWLIVGTTLKSFLIVLAIYAVSITIALSPVGELILILVENCRLPATDQERAYLTPIFEEVYEQAKNAIPSLNRKINLYIMDAMYVNAFAIGRKTVAVTRGAIEAFTEEELKGVLAHELGHMTYGHTKALLLSVIGNFFFTIIVWILRLLLSIADAVSTALANVNVVGIVFWLIALVIKIIGEISIFIFVNLGEVILALNSRSNEIQADGFSFSIGYGQEQISALYLLQKITMNTKLTLSEKMKASHPHLAYRIEYLEKLENGEITVEI